MTAAGESESPRKREALEVLCRTYWFPLYCYVRRCGHSHHDAEDLVQGYFASLLRGRPFRQVAPDKGRFRSFLLKTLHHFLANQHDRANALKRGGGQTVISLDVVDAEGRYRLEPQTDASPEQLFDQRWARSVMEQALARLRAEQTDSGNLLRFEKLRVFLAASTRDGEYDSIAAEFGMTAHAVCEAVRRLRERYRELVRLEVAQTVSTPQEVEGELRYLVQLLV